MEVESDTKIQDIRSLNPNCNAFGQISMAFLAGRNLF
jgi:hypothetical protein